MTITENRNKKERKRTIHWSVLFLSVFTYQLNQNTHVFVPEHTESSFPRVFDWAFLLRPAVISLKCRGDKTSSISTL